MNFSNQEILFISFTWNCLFFDNIFTKFKQFKQWYYSRNEITWLFLKLVISFNHLITIRSNAVINICFGNVVACNGDVFDHNYII